MEDDESEHAAEGTAAHWLGETCLCSGHEAWCYIGQVAPNGVEVTADMAIAVSVYTQTLAKLYPDAVVGVNCWVERRFYCPTIHDYFYGTADFVYHDRETQTLEVNDYKHGRGVLVSVEENSQCMYYACGALEELGLWNDVERVKLRIHQPRGFHPDGPVREWEVSTAALEEWLWNVLVPGMDRALTSKATASGEQCRFCPARTRACPQLVADMEEFEEMSREIDANTAPALTNEQLARFLNLEEVAKIAKSAAYKTAFGRLNAGRKIPGRKLVQGKVRRAWKGDTAAIVDAALAKFGRRAFTASALIGLLTPAQLASVPTRLMAEQLKSPSEIDKLPGGTQFTKRWAFKPQGELTVAKAEDPRAQVSVDTKSMFTPVRKGKRDGARERS